MRGQIRQIGLVGATAALLVCGPAIDRPTELGTAPGFAQGKSGESHGNSGSTGNGASKSASATSKSQSSEAKSGGKSTSAIHQLAADTGMSMGEISRLLKSWRSIDRADPAYAANVDNLNSLPGRQLAYARENLDAQLALASLQGLLGGATNTSYTLDALPDMDAYNMALDVLGGLDPQTVLQDPTATPDLSAAAETVLIYQASQAYDAAEQEAQSAFLATLAGNQSVYEEATHGQLRSQVNQIISLRQLADFY